MKPGVRPRAVAWITVRAHSLVRVAAPLLLAGLIAAGCSGDDSSSKASTATSAAAAAGSTTASSAASGSTAATKAPSGSTADTTADTSGSDSTVNTKFTGKGSSDFCSTVRDLVKDKGLTALADAEGFTKADWDKLGNAWAKMAASAPSEIKADAEAGKEFFDKLSKVAAKFDYDMSKVGQAIATDPDVRALFSDTTNFAAAGTRLSAYMKNVCKFTDAELGDTSATTAG